MGGGVKTLAATHSVDKLNKGVGVGVKVGEGGSVGAEV